MEPYLSYIDLMRAVELIEELPKSIETDKLRYFASYVRFKDAERLYEPVEFL